MKKNLLLVVVCTLFVTSAYAQERGFGYGIKAGVNIAKVTNWVSTQKSVLLEVSSWITGSAKFLHCLRIYFIPDREETIPVKNLKQTI